MCRLAHLTDRGSQRCPTTKLRPSGTSDLPKSVLTARPHFLTGSSRTRCFRWRRSGNDWPIGTRTDHVPNLAHRGRAVRDAIATTDPAQGRRQPEEVVGRLSWLPVSFQTKWRG